MARRVAYDCQLTSVFKKELMDEKINNSLKDTEKKKVSELMIPKKGKKKKNL